MPADVLAGHYRIERELGRGGMATVFLCTDTRENIEVALKLLRPEIANAVTTERFLREIQIVSELVHPRIPEVLEAGMHGKLPFYAMTYVKGESLRDRLKRDGQLPIADATRIAAEVLEPMTYAHARGILHRDIKPENILLSETGVAVLDFGIARAIVRSAGERLTATGVAVGTPAYMSPEQALADRDLDARSDIYSLGCVLYEMLAGAPPFTGKTPQILMARRFSAAARPLREIRRDIPVQIEAAVAKALARAPEDRWPSAAEFSAGLRAATVEAPSASPNELPAEDQLIEKLRVVFADSYSVEGELPGGGMSRLFLATEVSLRRRVVIKILPPELTSQMMLARFKRESEVTARLQHPHILPVISAGVREGLVHYIMPFIEGESLRARLKREGQLPVHDAVRLLREVVDALAYAHKQGVIHRDIKPENILIQDGHAVLADFGIAAALGGLGGQSGERLTMTGMSLGTVGYMAPEQALGDSNVDARSDIYAVGIVGYEIFAGAPPFTGATDQAILVAHLTREAPLVDQARADTPSAVVEAIRRAMQKDPASRFQTAVEFRDALDVGIGAPARRTEDVRLKKLLELPAKWKIGILGAVVVVAIAIVLLTQWRAPVGQREDITIAVAPFNTLSSGLQLWREGMVDVLARNLDGVGPLRTISPTMSIKGFTSVSDRESATALAKRTNAGYAIFGTIVGSPNDSVSLRATLVDVERDVVWEYEARDSTVEAAASKFTLEVLRELGKTHRIGAVRQSSFGSGSIEAVRAFLQGEQFFRRTSWDSAATSYSRAIGFDDGFAIALRRAAQVAGWQRNGSDSVARAFWLRAGAENRGVSPRDSLLLTADSLSAALAPLPSDAMDWPMLRRLFATVDAAASRYPDDPEIWFAVGEARYHLGYGSPVSITERQALDAFDRSIALDSAFAPAYVHAIELAFTLEGAEAGSRYAREYLKLKPTDDEAEGIAIVDLVSRAGGSTRAAADSVLNRASSDAIMAAYFTVRRWPDTAQTALRLLRSTTRRSRNSPSFVADSIRLWNFMPLQLAYRGRLSEAYRVMGNRPSRIFVEMTLLGGIPADTAAAVVAQWVMAGRPQAFFALPWLAQRGDSAQIRVLMGRADSASRVGTEFERRGARYRAASTRAWMSLARRDTADALSRFAALPDTLCIACYMDRLQAARLLAARGRLDQADNLLGQRLNTLITPTEVLIAFERGRVATRLGKREEALDAYGLVVAAWASGDPGLRPYVEEARRESEKLGGRASGR